MIHEGERVDDLMIHEGERVDDLQRKGYRIIQNPKWFCFGMDAVLLSAWGQVKKGERVLDLGTGTGIIPILMEARYPGEHFTGLEIQSGVADMARRSVALNDLTHRISITEGDIKEASSIFGRASFDVVTCNPPYMDDTHGIQNPSAPKAIARHEVLLNFEDVAREASACLKPLGRFYMVHRPRRLMDLLCTLRAYKLEPKRIRMIHPFVDKEANMVLVEAVKGGGVLMHVEAPLIVYQDVNQYTEEVHRMYYE